MLALEIETCPLEGVSLAGLQKALEMHDIAACLFSSSINNPLGCLTSEDHRQALVNMLEEKNIPLIEDDVYGELIYDGQRQKPAQFYSRKGLVLTCASFSKTVAPGYRIGWLLPGKFHLKAQKFKRALSCSSGLLQQLTLSEFIASGDYDWHLNRLKPVLKQNAERMISCIEHAFPAETGISNPQGGSVVWLELPRGVESEKLFDAAIEECISIVPGGIFSAGNRYRNFIRLSYGHPWSHELEQGVETLGRLVHQIT